MNRLTFLLCGFGIAVFAFAIGLRLVPSVGSIHASGSIHAIVLCGTCTIDESTGTKDVGQLILDEDSGNIWFYKGDAIFGGKNSPKLIGHMSEIGKPVVPATKP